MFYTEPKLGYRYPKNYNEVPKSIWRRAKCFLKEPERFGKVRRV